MNKTHNNHSKIVVLAYSGGLDTSFCLTYLIQNGFEVHTVLINTGGFTTAELETITARAYALGSTQHTNLDIVEKYYNKAIKYLIFGNVLKNNTYPLSVSAERVFQALEVIKYAKANGAAAIAHGSTGAGNDQIRFDLIFQTIAPEIEIITPIRDLQLSRQQEVEFLQQNGINYSWEKAQYSINKGIWGTSVGGKETLTSHLPLPEEAYPSPLQKTVPEKVILEFEKGELVGINHQKDIPANNILKLEALANAFAIGRDIHVGDTIIGIKGRVGFEAAAPLLIIKAHHLLEKHVLTKWQQYWKEQLGNWYGMLFHEGQFLDPVMRNIETFLTDSQKTVSGKVTVTLKPYHFSLDGVESAHDLMNSQFGQYGEMNNAWTAEEAKGFIKILGNAQTIYSHVNYLDYD
ncbi:MULTISPECIES: argininosuccinate synthase domain-containing protein [unclassified Flavobacterium]|uniref:argininosuccinate synthase domain-containing protein n=1 Tax=unclassified Flavobacterium TaxID=196869 RepID=UPI0008687DF7|nr:MULTISPECIES: argininosuccinate synthase domain-containing protein [unclassified Flavobacterium]MBN9284230.1 argininosuccinate synthase [Flavobacterium sp.]ODS80461.1 MAG: argininosuccinate synthase [Chryseobacterium sp. SCN 40-13]OJV70689.1 MAG: argininosuccinate synthase [Flavobacterium sp. 40-81]